MLTSQGNTLQSHTEAPRETRQIESEMSLMAENISCLEAGLKRLSEKLNPVLCHQPQTEEQKKDRPRIIAPLAEMINKQSERIRNLLAAIIYLEQAIQL